jgi:hypothetical protein
MRRVVSSQDIFSNSSENILFYDKNNSLMKRIEYKDVKINLLSLYSSLTSYSFFFPSSLDNRIAQKLGPHIVQYSPSM